MYNTHGRGFVSNSNNTPKFSRKDAETNKAQVAARQARRIRIESARMDADHEEVHGYDNIRFI